MSISLYPAHHSLKCLCCVHLSPSPRASWSLLTCLAGLLQWSLTGFPTPLASLILNLYHSQMNFFKTLICCGQPHWKPPSDYLVVYSHGINTKPSYRASLALHSPILTVWTPVSYCALFPKCSIFQPHWPLFHVPSCAGPLHILFPFLSYLVSYYCL